MDESKSTLDYATVHEESSHCEIPMPESTEVEEEKRAAKTAEMMRQAQHFVSMALPCAIYAIVYAVCMRRNHDAATMPIWIATLVGLVVYVLKRNNRRIKTFSKFVSIIMITIAVSTFLTGNEYIIAMNYAAEFMLLFVLVLHNFADDYDWSIGKYLGEIVTSTIGSIGFLPKPFDEGVAYLKGSEKKSNRKVKLVIIGIVIAMPVLAILIALLSSADAVFDNIISSAFKNIEITSDVFGWLFVVILNFFMAYCLFSYMEEKAPLKENKTARKGEPVIAVTVTSLIALLYLVFSVIQVLYLFVGGFSLPVGVTYAEYAREGFFELLFVCVINLALVLIIKKYVVRSRVLDIILLVISGSTYIMIASSAMRMIMYIQAYRLTFLRVFVLVALFTLSVLLAGVIVSIINEGFMFARFCISVICVIYAVFALSHVDYFIAKYNLGADAKSGLEYARENGAVYSYDQELLDYDYLAMLSTDAAPAIAEFFDEAGISENERISYLWFRDYRHYNVHDIKRSYSIRSFNASRYYAGKLLNVPHIK